MIGWHARPLGAGRFFAVSAAQIMRISICLKQSPSEHDGAGAGGGAEAAGAGQAGPWEER